MKSMMTLAPDPRVAELEAENQRLRLELEAERKQHQAARRLIEMYRGLVEDESHLRVKVIR